MIIMIKSISSPNNSYIKCNGGSSGWRDGRGFAQRKWCIEKLDVETLHRSPHPSCVRNWLYHHLFSSQSWQKTIFSEQPVQFGLLGVDLRVKSWWAHEVTSWQKPQKITAPYHGQVTLKIRLKRSKIRFPYCKGENLCMKHSPFWPRNGGRLYFLS